MAETVLKVVGPKRPVLAMSIIGYITSIPVFCDSGFVILSALNKSLSKKPEYPWRSWRPRFQPVCYTHFGSTHARSDCSAANNLHADLGMVNCHWPFW